MPEVIEPNAATALEGSGGPKPEFEQSESGLLVPKTGIAPGHSAPRTLEMRIVPANREQMKPGALILPSKGKEQELVLHDREATHAYGVQAEAKGEDWGSRFGMSKAGVIYKLTESPAEILDRLAKECGGFPPYGELMESAQELNFIHAEFGYENKKELERSQHLLVDFTRQYGDVCPNELFAYIFFLTKLGRFRSVNNDWGPPPQELAASDEFVDFVAKALADLDPHSVAFSYAHDAANLLAERYSKSAAHGILETLKAKHGLSGDLAQELLAKYSDLEKEFATTLDFSQMQPAEIFQARKRLALEAQNETETLREIPTNVGIEIEVRLSEDLDEGQERREDDPLRVAVEEGGRIELGVDGGDTIAEVRSLDGGLPFGEGTVRRLRRIARILECSADVVAFGTTHISVDRRFLDHTNALLDFAQFESERMEIKEVPISLSKGKQTAMDVSGYADQMMIVGAFADTSLANVKDFEALRDLNEKERTALLLRNQDSMLAIYLELARQSNRTDMIPALLRCATKGILPHLRTQALVKDLPFETLLPYIRNENTDEFARTDKLVPALEFTPFAKLKDFLMDHDISVDVRSAVAEHISECAFTDIEEFLRDEHVDYPVRKAAAGRLKKTPFAEIEPFLKDDTVSDTVRAEVANCMEETPAHELLDILKNKDRGIDAGTLRVITWHIKEAPLAEMKELLTDFEIDTSARIEAARHGSEIPLDEALAFFQSGAHPNILVELARRVAPIPHAKLKELFPDGSISENLPAFLTYRAAPGTFEEFLPLITDPSFPSSHAARAICRMEETPYGKLRALLLDDGISSYVIEQLALRLTETPWEEAREIIENEEIEYGIRCAVAERLKETSYHELEPFIRAQLRGDEGSDTTLVYTLLSRMTALRKKRENPGAIPNT